MSADPEPAPAYEPAPRRTSRLEEAIFRAVTLSTGRKALRLEGSFWDALDAIAAERDQTRNALIEEIVAEVADTEINASSHIRAYTTRYLLEKVNAQNERLAPAAQIALMQQAPIPSYAMARDKKLLKVNKEFLRMLQFVSGDPRKDVALETAQLSLDTPLAEIFELLETDDRPHQCGITVTVGTRQRRAVTRVVPLPDRPLRAVVGFIVS